MGVLPPDSSQLTVLFRTALPESHYPPQSHVAFPGWPETNGWSCAVIASPLTLIQNNSKGPSQIQRSEWSLSHPRWSLRLHHNLTPLSVQSCFLPSHSSSVKLCVLNFLLLANLLLSQFRGKRWEEPCPVNSKRGSIDFNFIWKNLIYSMIECLGEATSTILCQQFHII